MAIAVEMIVCSECALLITECFVCKKPFEIGDEIDCEGGGYHKHTGCEK